MAQEAPVRKMLRYSIVILFTMAIFFFLMIFLLGLAEQHKLKNQINEQVAIQQNEIKTWGQIPGKFGYSWERAYKLYEFRSIPTFGASIISLDTVGWYNYTLTRDFADASWYPQKSVVSYTEDYEWTAVPEPDPTEAAANADATVKTINMGAYSLWEQMVQKPKYFKAWQALTQAYELMVQNNVLNRLYAYNAYELFYKNYDDVKFYVLNTLSDEKAQIIYEDPNYGMNNLKGLSQWMDCTSQKNPQSTSAIWAEIVDYYTNIGIPLTESQMMLACGRGSMANQIQAQIEYSILYDDELRQKVRVDYDELISPQWGFLALTYGENINFVGVDPVYSVAELDPIFPYPPEFGAFILDPTRQNATFDYTFNYTVSSDDFSLSTETFSNFLNTAVMRTFYVAYESQDMSMMANRFQFNNWQQVEYFHAYLDEMIDKFLLQDSTYDIIALASLLDKNQQNTLGYLMDTVPLQTAARVVASKIVAAGTNCTYYFDNAGVRSAKVTNICSNYDFSDVNSVVAMLNGTWYGDAGRKEFKDATGITNNQCDTFFSDDSEQFGGVVYDALAEISTQYGCASSTNCTAVELGGLQWGSLGVTRNPNSEWGDTYMPVADTVTGWGDASWIPFGMATEIREYPQYTAAQAADYTYLSASTASVMSGSQVDLYGLNGFFNWQSFLIPYYLDDTTVTTEWMNAWGIDSAEDLQFMIYYLRTQLETLAFGGATKDISVSDMLDGYESDYADLIGGDYFAANDFSLTTLTTPVRNNIMGSQVSVEYGVLTGSNGVDEIGEVRLISGENYVNKMVAVYNGTGYEDIAQQAPQFSIQSQRLQDVSNGMQFPPDISQDATLKVYDSRNIKIQSYKYDSSTSIGEKELALDKFIGTNHGDDISFGYNLPVFQKPYACYGCFLNPEDSRTIYIDDVEYTMGTEPSDNYMLVQPDTGYTYEIKKNSTVYMIIGGNQTYVRYEEKVTPFPSLDPLYGAPFPLYEYTETLKADEDTFYRKFGYVANKDHKSRATLISMSVFAALFLILGIVAFTMYKMIDPKRRNNSEEVLVRDEALLD